VSKNIPNYEVRVDWTTVMPLGDTLAVSTVNRFDAPWVEAFAVVLREHEDRFGDRPWRAIDFEFVSDDDEPTFELFVRGIEPGTQATDVRRTVDDLVQAANTVARVGTHVYDLARELRQPEPVAPRVSTPPPSIDPLEDELRIDAA
jgi:hypothetical protein